MSQNISLWGASYSDVPSVTLPKTGGGSATFTDVTDTTATASDVASGKYFYTSSGIKTEGTASGGGGGGLVYEMGTWTASANTNKPTISFANTHTSPPILINLYDVGSPFTPPSNAIVFWQYTDTWLLTGDGFPSDSTTTGYALVHGVYVSKSGSVGSARSSLTHNSSESGSGSSYPSYFATTSAFSPYTLGSTRYYIANRTYKWIAVWAPTT